MVRPFYRFRSVDALLGEHAELDCQEIYFASSAELNDPMEGFKDLYWQGDEIVWRNLIRHYALCALDGFNTLWSQRPRYGGRRPGSRRCKIPRGRQVPQAALGANDSGEKQRVLFSPAS